MQRQRPEAPQLRAQRRDRMIREHEHDPYRLRAKLPDPTLCPECGAVYRDGRWTWLAAPGDAHRALCPACRRIRDDYPGGELRLSGSFVETHRAEILGLLRNLERRERSEHPLRRIIQIREADGAIQVATTEGDLARALGEAVRDAYRGDLDYRYAEESAQLRVRWHRDG